MTHRGDGPADDAAREALVRTTFTDEAVVLLAPPAGTLDTVLAQGAARRRRSRWARAVPLAVAASAAGVLAVVLTSPGTSTRLAAPGNRPALACAAGGLALEAGPVEQVTELRRQALLRITSTTAQPCTLAGSSAVAVADAGGGALPGVDVAGAASDVVLPAGRTAVATLSWSTGPDLGSPTSPCRDTAVVTLRPAGGSDALQAPLTTTVCGPLTVSEVVLR